MACLIERASVGNTVSRTALNEALVELFEAILGPKESEWAIVKILSKEEEPSDADRAKLFEKSEEADDPIAILSTDGFALAQLKRLARSHSGSLKYRSRHLRPDFAILPFDAMSAAEQEVLHEHLHHLKTYYESNVQRGRPENIPLNTALIGLGEIFVSLAGLSHHEFELPYSPESRFIQFAAIATAPRFHSNFLAVWVTFKTLDAVKKSTLGLEQISFGCVVRFIFNFARNSASV